jgi:hypothetical protein
MGSWANLVAISINASSGSADNWATKKQVGAIAGRLGKHIKAILLGRGLSMGKEAIRDLRLRFLNDVLAGVRLWSGDGGDVILTTSQLSFGAASAVIDWLESGSAAEDMATWLKEQKLPYTEEMVL